VVQVGGRIYWAATSSGDVLMTAWVESGHEAVFPLGDSQAEKVADSGEQELDPNGDQQEPENACHGVDPRWAEQACHGGRRPQD